MILIGHPVVAWCTLCNTANDPVYSSEVPHQYWNQNIKVDYVLYSKNVAKYKLRKPTVFRGATVPRRIHPVRVTPYCTTVLVNARLRILGGSVIAIAGKGFARQYIFPYQRFIHPELHPELMTEGGKFKVSIKSLNDFIMGGSAIKVQKGNQDSRTADVHA